MQCAKCGREVKYLFYFEGIGYGSECFKTVTGMTVEEHESNQRIKKEKQTKEEFILNNPIIYVCIDKDSYNKKDSLKANKFQYHYKWWIGFNIEGLEELEFLQFSTEEYFQGWGYCYSSKTAYEFLASYEEDEKSLYREIETELKKKDTSNWIGQEKEKVQLKVTLNKITGYSNDFGWTNIYIFKDENDNTLTWKTAKDMEWEEGQEIEIKATVKAHEEYDCKKQTSILRVKEV